MDKHTKQFNETEEKIDFNQQFISKK